MPLRRSRDQDQSESWEGFGANKSLPLTTSAAILNVRRYIMLVPQLRVQY
jgi:hypothetical protein